MQPKEFFGWLCKSQQDATFCLFLIRNLFFLRDKNLSHSQSLIKNTYFLRFKKVFTGTNEVKYHLRAHYQELDYLLNPSQWAEPYVIDAKYKPRYKNTGGISTDDAREVSGYARLSSIYKELGLNEETAPPIKCLIIYPDQEEADHFTFTRTQEPHFNQVSGYVRFYKLGIKLPII